MAHIVRAAGRSVLLAWAAITLAFAWTGAPLPWLALTSRPAGAASDISTGTLLNEVHRNKDNPFVDAVAGGICAGIAFCLLWLNEGHAVRIEQLLELVRRRVREVGVSAVPENQRHLVFLKGEAVTSDRLVLSEWGGLAAPANAAKLRATALMYQWEQEKDDQKVTYKKVWKHHRVNSDRFQQGGHGNPPFPVAPTCMKLAKVTVGDFILSKKMLGKLQKYQPCDVDDAVLQAIRTSPRMEVYGEPVRFAAAGQWPLDPSKPALFFPLQGNLGSSPTSPQIGDLMVIFEYVPCGPVSLLAVQVPFETVHSGQILVPGTRCRAGGRTAEITEVSPPPRPVKVHFTDNAPGQDTDYFEVNEVECAEIPEPWAMGPNHWTFVPLQFNENKAVRSMWVRANTATTNIADEMGQTLLGDNEDDIYVEDDRSVMLHIQHGTDQLLKLKTFNCVKLASAFLDGSSPDEICLAFEGTYSCQEAIRKEKEIECKINAGVRLFGFILMWVSFNYMLRPLTWVCSFLWILGSLIFFLVHAGTFACACVCSGCTMGGAWIFYRPSYSLLVLSLPLAVLYLAHLKDASQPV